MNDANPTKSSPATAVTIRHARPDDYRAVAAIHTCPEVVRGTLQLPFPSEELWRKRLAEPDEGLIVLVACRGEEVVGITSLHTSKSLSRRRHAGALGLVVRDGCHHRGIGTALLTAILDLADNWLGLTRLELEVYVDNQPAFGLYKKFGFEVEGTHHQHALRAGQLVDVHSMARLRSLAQ